MDETPRTGTPFIAPGYISSYTGPEIDTAITRANEMWYSRIEAEEVGDAVSAVRHAQSKICDFTIEKEEGQTQNLKNLALSFFIVVPQG